MFRFPFRVGALIAALAASPARAEGDEAFEFFREEAMVSVASRRPEAAWRAPVAVDVVTAEEFKAYGYSSLADLLRFRAGMDVICARSADGNRAIVSARGFSRDFVAEMQVLVDGRSVYSPFLGGVYWASLPVQMQDIERVEIVRGPNAALYGSNAALGVINIITRKPAGSLYASGGNRGIASSEAAEAGAALGGVRVSHSYEQAPGHPAPNGVGDANDFLHSNKLNLRARFAPDTATEVEFLSGGAWQTMGVPGFSVDIRAKQRDEFQAVRAERDMGSAGTLEASVSHSELNIEQDRLLVRRADLRAYQYDAEALHRLGWADDKVHSAAGASWRTYSDQLFLGHPAQQNRVVRGFTQHSVSLTDSLTAVAGVSLEDSRVGGLQPAWQGAVLYSPREEHTLRVSYSRAPTMPPLFNKYSDFTLGGTTRFLGKTDLSPQQLSSCEAGWRGRMLDGAFKSDVALFFLEIKDRLFRHVEVTGPPRILEYDNRNRASARGAEASAEYAFAAGRSVFANYTFEKILDDKGVDSAGTDLRRGTPLHKADFGARSTLGRGFPPPPWSATRTATRPIRPRAAPAGASDARSGSTCARRGRRGRGGTSSSPARTFSSPTGSNPPTGPPPRGASRAA